MHPKRERDMIKAVLLDMYGVIVRQTGDDFVPYVQKTFPALKSHEILTPWFKADVGELCRARCVYGGEPAAYRAINPANP